MKKSWQTLRFLAGKLWEYDRMIYFFLFLSCVFGSAVPYIGIYLPKYVISGLLEQRPVQYWILLFSAFGVATLSIYGIYTFSTQSFKGRIHAARNGCFGKMLTEKMQRIQYMLLEKPSVQDLCFRANFLFWSDDSGMAGVFDGFNHLLAGTITMIGMIAIIFSLSAWLPLLLILLILLNVYMLAQARKNENMQRPAASRLSRELDYLTSVMRDVVAGKDIRLYGLSGYLMQWYRRVSAERQTIQRKVRVHYLRAELWSLLLALLRDSLLYSYLIVKVMKGEIGADQFILFIGAANGFTLTLLSMIESFLNIRQFLSQADDFQQVMALEEETHSDLLVSNALFSHITIQNVQFSYPGGFSLRINDLTIHRGEHIAVVGPNGSGKTTLVKLILGLYLPKEGAVSVFATDGVCIQGAMFGLFSTVMQKIYQYAMTVEENISFQETSEIDFSKLHRVIDRASFGSDIASMPRGGRTMLRKDFDPSGINLSGGQQQKLALARALYKDAPIMVLDEPSASLDPIAEQNLYETFHQLFGEKACIYVSHRLSSVHFCSRIIVMNEGQIEAMGSHEELMRTCPLYERMYIAQSQPYQG